MDYKIALNGKDYPYALRYSKRARYLRVKLSGDGLISLVVPKGASLRDAQAFLKSKVGWLEKNLQSLPAIKPFSESRPEILQLDYLNEVWRIYYEATADSRVVLNEIEDNRLILNGNIDNQELVFKELGAWLKPKAVKVIPKRLNELAEKHGFHYNRVTIRGQKTRWGSCSSQKNINLNYKLLFLQQPLVDYVLIHELCHTLEMNHSQRFWSLVEDCDQNYKQHDRLVNQASRTIPI